MYGDAVSMVNSFTRHERIRLKNDFRRVYEQGKKIVSSSFILYYHVGNETRQYRRLGIIVSKRVGNAVIRNRCKRVVREIFRKNKERCPQGTDIIVIVRREMIRKCYSEVQEELFHALQTP